VGGHFFQNKSFVCVEITFFRSKIRNFSPKKHWGGLFIIIPCMPKRKINSHQLLKKKQDRANLQKPIAGK
jgi:hypothetical protein